MEKENNKQRVLEAKVDYPSVTPKEQKCQKHNHDEKGIPPEKRKQKATVTCSVQLPNDADAIKKALRTYGPLKAGFNADGLSSNSVQDQIIWQGPLDKDHKHKCPSDAKSIDHAVVIVGYGEEKMGGVMTPYWKLRNSWGTERFGGKTCEKGYFKIHRGINKCGIESQVFKIEVAIDPLLAPSLREAELV